VSILCFLKKLSSEPCLHLFLLGAIIACLIRVLLYRRNVYNFVKRHSEHVAIFLKKLEKNREYVIRIIQSLSVYDFISDERKITVSGRSGPNPNNPVVIFHSLSIASLTTEGGENRRWKGLELFKLIRPQTSSAPSRFGPPINITL
jgi:hypothetical protein